MGHFYQGKKFICVLAVIILSLTFTACPRNEVHEQPVNQELPPAENLPLHKTPGLHLIYTVNDPRAGTIGADNNAHVLIADPDGSRREVLFSYPGFIFHTVPSPDGTHIAFVAIVIGPEGQDERHLFLYDLDSDSYNDVSAPGYYSRAVETAPIFSHNSRTVLFISRWSVESGEFNIFKCDVASGRIEGLYTEPVEEVPLSLMPDGRRCIAVTRVPNATGIFEYISIDISTGAEELLHRFNDVTKVGTAHPDESGETIYCDIKLSEEVPGGLAGTRSREILSIDLATGTETRLLEPNTVSYVYQLFKDADGNDRLLIRRQEAIADEGTPMSFLAISAVDGSDFQYLTDAEARSYPLAPPTNIPHVSPDHSYLFFYRKDPEYNYEDLWVMKPDGSDPINISNTASFNEGSAGWIVLPY